MISSAVLRTTLGTLHRRKEAFQELCALGGRCDAVPDPVAWQREWLQDRPLPGLRSLLSIAIVP